MTPQEFVAKWRHGGDERRDSQPFFEDLCQLIGHPTPRTADPKHEWFCYERGAAKTSGGRGWADVWKKGCFGWEFKGTGRDLEAAHAQLKNYADALDNPPLLIVSDLQKIVIHTHFTNTVKRTYEFFIEDLLRLETRQIVEAAFRTPEALKPGVTRSVVTKDAADNFSELAQSLRKKGHDPHAVAHFLNRLLFCMFAEDIGLLPSMIFSKTVEKSGAAPELFEKRVRALFSAMHKGGDLAFENIEWFNGGLFNDDSLLPLDADEIQVLHRACKLDWSEIEPSIFGTLFERGLDPGKRSQLGAHYTDPETIMKIVRPVVLEPLLRDWDAEKGELVKLLGKAQKTVSKAATARFNQFLDKVRAFRVLDPACGSGNFLYLALRALKDFEKRVLIEAEAIGLPRQFPGVGPAAVMGIELNDYAAELARVTIWIGEIQWMIQNGYGVKKAPILQDLNQIECRDAVLGSGRKEAEWPAADVVIGNPPFVGNKKMLGELGEEYTTQLREAFADRMPGGVDLVCYWFERAANGIKKGKLQRAGFVSTQAIRAGANRTVLEHAAESGGIFNAWSDEPWINEGAAVRVSMICFGKGHSSCNLDGVAVDQITPSLTPGGINRFDPSRLKVLPENAGIAFQGPVKVGPFDIPGETARKWLELPNPDGSSNAEVLRPWANGQDVVKRPSDRWIVDFGHGRSEKSAAFFETPFRHVLENVKPMRDAGRREGRKKNWWLHGETVPAFRKALAPLSRYISTPRVAKHRIFVWLDRSVLPDSRLYAIVRDDDVTFGILQSRIHEIWALATCSWHGKGNDPTYNAESCFETFPFPDGLTPNLKPAAYAADSRAERIATAAKTLSAARDRWLNPPEWTDRVRETAPGYPDRIVPKAGFEEQLSKRTLTNLYNKPEPWLATLQAELDDAVAAAYGWKWPIGESEVLAELTALNERRAGLGLA